MRKSKQLMNSFEIKMSHKNEILIQLKNINKSFNQRNVLNDINLDIYQGESVVILGESGSGKSVLLNLIMGFEKADSGSIYIFGNEIHKASKQKLENIRQHFAVVFQNSAIFDSLSIKENVLITEIIKEKSPPQDSTYTKSFTEIMKSVGLDPADEDNKPSELSGGMKKRLAIARVLALDPDVILYDEPTAGLDPITGKKISELIYKLHCNDNKKTHITVTHDYYYAIKNASIIYYLEKINGELIRLVTEKELDDFTAIDEKIKFLSKKIDNIKNESINTREVCIGKEEKIYCKSIMTFFERFGNFFFLLFQFGLPYRKKDIYKRFNTLGLNSIPLILIIGFFIGMLITLQFYISVESYKHFADLKIPKTISKNLLILFAPLLTGLLLSGKVGTLISSEIGSKNYLNQINALKTVSICPERFLLAPIYYSLLLSVPFLTFIFAFSGIVGGYVVWLSFGESGLYYSIIYLEGITSLDILFVIFKSLIIATLISLISYQLGLEKKTSTEDISSSTTKAFAYCSVSIIGFELINNYIYSLL